MEQVYSEELPEKKFSRERDRETRRKLYVGGTRAAPKREIDGIDRHGFVVTLKDSYGFIESPDFKDHIFFHFIEVKGQNEALPINIVNDGSLVKIGDKVSFNIFFNEKRNKEEAMNVRILEGGKSLTDSLVKKEVSGFIKIVARTRRQTKSSNDSKATTGIIRIVYDDKTEEEVAYECDNVNNLRTILHVGDEILCNIVQEHHGHRKHATDVRLVKENPKRRYKGILRVLSSSEGIIYVAELNKDIKFCSKDAKSDTRDLSVGQEVEFNLESENTDLYATLVTSMASTLRKEIQEGRYRGIVQKECWPSYLIDAYRLDASTGLIRAFTGQDKGIEFPFTSDDVTAAFATLHRGDEVDFKVSYNPESGRRKAMAISLSKSVNEPKERGIILSLDSTGGTLLTADGHDLGFHISEFFTRDENRRLNIGDLVEYVVFKQNDIAAAALRISHVIGIPMDDVEIVAQGCRGLILQEITSANHSEPGKIQIKRDGDIKIATFRFEDVLETSKIPKTGDKAEFDLAISKTHGEYSAVRVMRVDVSSLVDGEYEIIVPSEQGVLQNLKEGFGFIRTPAREGNLFFHFSEYKGTELELKVGMVLEYTLVMDKKLKKPCAIRVRRVAEDLSNGISPKIFKAQEKSDLVDVRLCGIVTAEFINKHKSKLYQEEARYGEIEYTDAGKLHKIRFNTDHVERGWLGLHVGDQVEFSIGPETNISTGSKVRPGYAHKIVLLCPSKEPRYQGIVVSVRDGFGFVKSSPRDQEIFFHFSEFTENGVTSLVNFGDEVEYNQILRGGKPYAIRLERLSSGTLGRVESGRIESIKDSIITIATRSGLFFSCNSTEMELKDVFLEGDHVELFVQVSPNNTDPIVWKLKKGHSSLISPSGFNHILTDDSTTSSLRKDRFMTKSATEVSDTVPMDRRPHRLILGKLHSSGDSSTRSMGTDASRSFFLLRDPKGPDGTPGFKLSRNI